MENKPQLTTYLTVLGLAGILGISSVFFGLMATVLAGILLFVGMFTLTTFIPSSTTDVLRTQSLSVWSNLFMGCWCIATVCYLGMFLRGGLWKIPRCRQAMEPMWNFFRSRLSHAAVVISIIMVIVGCACGDFLANAGSYFLIPKIK